MIKQDTPARVSFYLACICILIFAVEGCNNQKHPKRMLQVKSALATAVPVTSTLTPSYFLHIADIDACEGKGRDLVTDDIDWGDGHDFGSLGSPAGSPQFLNYLVGQHHFSKTGVFNIKFTLTINCNDNGTIWTENVSGSSTAYVFNQPIPVTSITAPPAALAAGQKVSCTVTLSAKAGLGGSQVHLMSDSSAVQVEQDTLTIAAGQNSGKFRVVGVSHGTANIFVTSGEGTPAASTQITVN
jgi:hypothetical protein